MATKLEDMTPAELKAQADALLAAADQREAEQEAQEPAVKSAKKSTRKKKTEDAEAETPRLLTDEEAKKAGILRLDDKQVAALPAASWLINNEKLRELDELHRMVDVLPPEILQAAKQVAAHKPQER